MKETLLTYVKWVKDNHDRVERNEQATMQSLIGPLFTLLGYNLADPQECTPEFRADFGKGVKAATPVDWAFHINGNLAFFVEAKAAGAQITRYDQQLGMYFAKAPGVKLGILTNGTQWRFFSDLVHLHLMDTEPFFTWNVLNHDPEPALGLLTILQKSRFTPQGIRKFAERKHQQEPLDQSRDPMSLTTQDRLMAYLRSKQAEHGMTPVMLEKVKFLNPEGIKDGVFCMINTGGEGNKKWLPKLQSVLPPGAVIKTKFVSIKDIEEANAQGLFPVRKTAARTEPGHAGTPDGEEERSGIPLIEWVVAAFRSLGGSAHLRDVYKEVRRLGYDERQRPRRRSGGEDLNKLIRKRIYEHCSDSPQFIKDSNDLFRHKGYSRSGMWELRAAWRKPL